MTCEPGQLDSLSDLDLMPPCQVHKIAGPHRRALRGLSPLLASLEVEKLGRAELLADAPAQKQHCMLQKYLGVWDCAP